MAKKASGNGRGNGDVVRRLYRAIEERDLETIDTLGGDAPFENVAFGVTVSLRQDSQENMNAFSDMKIEIVDMVESGETVMVEGIGRGRHTGALSLPDGEIAPTGRRMELRFVDIYRIANGRIRSGRFYMDALGMLKQLGVGQGAGKREAAGASDEAGPALH